jgi:hypothetical protein
VNLVDSTIATSEVARLVATGYDFATPDRCRLMHAGLNDTYAVDINGRQYALRLHGRDK